MAFQTKAKLSTLTSILYLDIKRLERLQWNASKGPNCKQTPGFEFHIMTRFKWQRLIQARLQLRFITNHRETQQFGDVTKGEFSATPFPSAREEFYIQRERNGKEHSV